MPTQQVAGFLVLCLAISPITHAASVADINIEIPYKKFVLTNGLTVIVHEDHKAPIVAVKLWYHVGSKDEKPGKTGFAHLFEHLLFTGSEHLKSTGDQRAFFEAMERIGATDMNGTTDPDRTDYFENVPVNALDVALWIESDRMGHFLGSIDQARLDVQRGVVQNEKRQGENQPYGLAWDLITRGTAPPGHPYSWTVIGSMEDLNAASLEDVRTWFKTYYGAANTILVLAGDIDSDTARRKAEQYFGHIPSGPPVARYQQWIPKISGTRRQKLSDRVPQARLYKVWNIPAFGEAENNYLDMARDVLAMGKTSRIYKRLVYDEQIATHVSAYVDAREISGMFVIIAMARPGEDLVRIEAVIDEELAKFLADGPTRKELERVKAGKFSWFVRTSEQIGGINGKADILARSQTFRGDPAFYLKTMNYVRDASLTDLRDAARKWLTDDVYILEIHPYPEYGTNIATVDRSKLPTPGEAPEFKFPALQRATLSNGLKLILAERRATPMVNFTMEVDAGFASDQFAIPGAARLATEMLDEGTARRTSLQISEELTLLGASISTDSELDSSSVKLSALTSMLDPALEIYADVILNPSFPEADFRRLQKRQLAAIKQEKVEPVDMALRVFPAILYGSEHAYGNPLTGSGTETSVAKLTPADARKFHQTWFKPDNCTLLIVGDTTLEQITPKLEKLFGSWKPGKVPTKNLATVQHQKKPSVYLIDRPGSIQSVILAGHIAPPKSNPAEIAIETMNTVLGNTFTARINMNLREGKHWSYGAWSTIPAARGQRPFIVYAPVQTDKTRESLIELDKELRDILGRRPPTEEELKTAQANQTLRLPGAWETISAVGNSLGEIVRFGLPDDYFTTYPGKVRALSVTDLSRAAKEVVRPDSLVWVIVGDRAKIESGIRDLAWGDIQFLDADGNRL
ncbi:MAG TPA: pitrilysin family protein [Verrucomicrobiae bacterium]|nr:pitrilysin family protein [Verrucomicrobiae bacterium]